MLHIQTKRTHARLQRLQNLQSRGDHLLTNTIARDGCEFVRLHRAPFLSILLRDCSAVGDSMDNGPVGDLPVPFTLHDNLAWFDG